MILSIYAVFSRVAPGRRYGLSKYAILWYIDIEQSLPIKLRLSATAVIKGEKAMGQRLTAEAVDRKTEDAKVLLNRCIHRYRKGIAPPDGVLASFRQVIYGDVIGDFLRLSGIHYSFSAQGWMRFCNDWTMWKAGGRPESTMGEPWLFCDRLDERITDKASLDLMRRAKIYGLGASAPETEASPPDRAEFFRLIDAFHVPLAYFQPAPADMIQPSVQYTHTYAAGVKCLIRFHCTDDGGLSKDPDPAGKSYVLTNAHGLKAHVCVQEVRPREKQTMEPDIDDYMPKARYLGSGTIEGYTAGSVRPMTIRTGEGGKIVSLGTCLDINDLNVYSAFPLWRAYFAWQDDKERLIRRHCREMVSLFCPDLHFHWDDEE